MEFLFSCSTWYLTCQLTCRDIAMNTRSKIPNLRLPMHQLLLRDLNILFLFICGFLRFRPGSVFQRPKAWKLLIIHVQGNVIILLTQLTEMSFTGNVAAFARPNMLNSSLYSKFFTKCRSKCLNLIFLNTSPIKKHKKPMSSCYK